MTHSKILLPLLAALLTAAAIYLTPAKHFTLIEPSIDELEPEVFYELYQKDPHRYLFLDVRSESSYREIHAKDSLNVPLHEMYDKRHELPKRGKEIVLICGGNRASGVAYGYLEHYGFFNLKRITGGIEAWIAAGLPTESENGLGLAPSRTVLAPLDCPRG